MILNYTKLGILLLRIYGITLIAQSIPSIAISIPALFRMNEYTKLGIPNYAISIILQPIVGLLLISFSVPIARKSVSFLDRP